MRLKRYRWFNYVHLIQLSRDNSTQIACTPGLGISRSRPVTRLLYTAPVVLAVRPHTLQSLARANIGLPSRWNSRSGVRRHA